jgi:hypothetical protein
MKSLPAYFLVTFKSEDYLTEIKTLVAPCNLYSAIGKLTNNPTYEGSVKWHILIEPSEIEYFEGEDE